MSEPIGFYVRALDAGHYSVRLDLQTLLFNRGIVRHFHHWMLTRGSEDNILLYLENSMTPNLWGKESICISSIADVIKAIQLCPAYDNIKLIVSQAVSGIGSYLVLSTPNIFWGPLGFVCFDGWMSGKDITEYDQAQRADIEWIRDLFKTGVKLGLYSEQDVEDHQAGRMITVGLKPKLTSL